MNRPFDAARYAGLLEGLEVTEASLAQILRSTPTFRVDPEYFQKQHLADSLHAASKGAQFSSFSDLGLSVDASAFYPSIEPYYDQGELPFLRVADVDSVIDFESCTRIPASLCEQLPTLAKVKPGDIVFTKGGSIARIGLVTADAAVSRDLIFLNSSKLPEADRAFLYLYFQTDYFNRILIRSSSQTAQPHLTITLVRELPVFCASSRLKDTCLRLVSASYEARSASIEAQQAAEYALLHALDLANWQPPQPLSYIRSSRDAFAAGRLDAEYYAPRVVELMARLGRHGQRIRDVAPARHERFVASATGSFDYIEIGNLRADGTATTESVAQADAPSRATWRVRANDVITSMVRPIRRLSALVAPEQDGSVCSSGFVVLEPKAIAPETLLAYLRLPPVCELMDLHTSASLYPAIAEADLLSLPFPRIDAKVQAEVVANVRAAQASRQRATALLDAAKRAVEIAIENSEAAALAWLQDARARAEGAP